jgi:hypothetical protein
MNWFERLIGYETSAILVRSSQGLRGFLGRFWKWLCGRLTRIDSRLLVPVLECSHSWI